MNETRKSEVELIAEILATISVPFGNFHAFNYATLFFCSFTFLILLIILTIS